MNDRPQDLVAVPRILLVEDSDRDAELTLDALSEHDLANEVLRLRNGVEALDYLHQRGPFTDRSGGNPAVVLLDLKMPKVDGLEVLRQVKVDPELRRVPIVVMTSSREEKDLATSYELGVNAYVVKPLRFAEFSNAVKQVGAFWAILNEVPPGTPKRTGINAV